MTLTLRVSEDAFRGDAQFFVTVDGMQYGGLFAATASHTLGEWQDISIQYGFSSDQHTIGVNFVNDAWGGTADTDRNLYVQSVTIDDQVMLGTAAENNATNGGQLLDPNAAVMAVNGTATFVSPATGGTEAQELIIYVSGDNWNGNASFLLTVDGHEYRGSMGTSPFPVPLTVTASHARGEIQAIVIDTSHKVGGGLFGPFGPDKIDITFLNDAWGGTPDTDRNLYVHAIEMNGVHFAGSTAANNAANGAQSLDPNAAVLAVNGTVEFNVHYTAPPEIMG